MRQDNNEAASAPALHDVCKACDGEGVIHTGIDEAPVTQCRKCDGSDSAHIAPQAAADTGAVDAAGVDTPAFQALLEKLLDEYDEYDESGPVPESATRAFRAMTTHIETVYGAQQREAGAAYQARVFDKIRARKDARIAELEAALARQPVSEGLTEELQFLRNVVADAAPMLRTADRPKTADILENAVNSLDRALAAVPPAKAEGLTDEQICATALEHGYGIFGGDKARPFTTGDQYGQKMLGFVRAILAQQAKGAQHD